MNPTFHSATLFFNQTQLDMPLNKMSRCEELYVDFRNEKIDNGEQIQLMVHPKKDVILTDLEIRFDCQFPADAEFFVNGFLSGNATRLYKKNTKLLGKGWLTSTPDFPIEPKTEAKETIQSWSYGYVVANNKMTLLGSTNETTAFTAVEYDFSKNQLVIKKDVAGLTLNHSFPILDIVVLTGSIKKVSHQYKNLIQANGNPPKLNGWIAKSSAQVNEILELNSTEKIPLDLVMIGAGYEKTTGDWFYSNDQFSEKIPALIQKIHQQDLKAGITLSPILTKPYAEIARQNTHILNDEKGKPIVVKIKNETYHILDIFEKSVQDYLQSVCFTFVEQWGIDLIKLENLWYGCAKKRTGKTNAQVLQEVLKLFKNNCTNTLLWTADLPTIPGWNQSDFSNITVNDYLDWNGKFPLLYFDAHAPVANQQLVSALAESRYIAWSSNLANVSFSTSGSFTPEQEFTQLFLNRLLGHITLIDADPKLLSPEVLSEWNAVELWKSAKLLEVIEKENQVFQIVFSNNNNKYQSFVNLQNKKITTTTSNGAISLEAGETLILSMR